VTLKEKASFLFLCNWLLYCHWIKSCYCQIAQSRHQSCHCCFCQKRVSHHLYLPSRFVQQGSFTTTAGTTNKMNDVWFDVDLREAA
jgi:hypothetical protein